MVFYHDFKHKHGDRILIYLLSKIRRVANYFQMTFVWYPICLQISVNLTYWRIKWPLAALHGQVPGEKYRPHKSFSYLLERIGFCRLQFQKSIILSWWRHEMEKISALLAIYAENSPVPGSPHKGQWRGALMFSLICTRINGWVNNGEAGDWRRYRAHYDVTVMINPLTPEQNRCRYFAINFCQTIFALIVWLKCHWNVFAIAQLTVFMYWLGTDKSTSHICTKVDDDEVHLWTWRVLC